MYPLKTAHVLPFSDFNMLQMVVVANARQRSAPLAPPVLPPVLLANPEASTASGQPMINPSPQAPPGLPSSDAANAEPDFSSDEWNKGCKSALQTAFDDSLPLRDGIDAGDVMLFAQKFSAEYNFRVKFVNR